MNHPTVVIAESRSYNEQTARGEARVHATPSPHVRLAAARAWLAIADALAATPAGSYQAAKRGLDELGPDYTTPEVRDETRVRFMFAEEEFEKQNDQRADELMLRILRSRISMYLRRYKTEVE